LSFTALSDLLSSCGQTIYGELWDEPLQKHNHWLQRTSFEYSGSAGNGRSHRLDLFHNPEAGHLDLLIWFDEVTAFGDSGERVSIDGLSAEVTAWWDGMRAGTVAPGEHGIFLLAPGQFRPWWRRWWPLR